MTQLLSIFLFFSNLSYASLSVQPRMPVASPTPSNWVSEIKPSGATVLSQPSFTDISGNLSNSQLPTSETWPSSGTVQAITPSRYSVLISGTGATATTVSPGPSGVPLVSQGPSANPSFGPLSLSVGVSGVLPVLNGGTGVTSSTGSGSVVLSAGPTFTGTVIIPSPFTLGATSMTSTGTQLNYLNAATGTTGTTSTNVVFSGSPTLTTPTFTTNATDPLLIGGSGASSTLTLESTSGIGTTDSIILKTGSQTTGMTLNTSQVANFPGTTDSSSTSTGTITTAGGLGVAKKGYFGSGVNINADTAITHTVTTGTNRLQSITASNTSGNFTAGVENSTGGSIFTGTSAYSAVFGTTANKAIEFATGNASRMMLDSSGKLGIGRTPQSALDVTGGNISLSGVNAFIDYGVGAPGSSNAEWIFFQHGGAAGADIAVQQGGTGSLRPLNFKMNSTVMATLGTTGNFTVGVNNNIVGSDGTSDATAGNIGEYIESTVTSDTSFPTSNTTGDCTSITLSAGDWDISNVVYTTSAGGTNSYVGTFIGTASGNNSTNRQVYSNYAVNFGPSGAVDVVLTIPSWRTRISSSTTYYSKVVSAYTGTAPKYECRISARRMR